MKEDFLKQKIAIRYWLIGKGFDRVHNMMTMVGGFTPQKQVSYVNETLDFVVPLIKKARRLYPNQEGVYHNIKFVLTNQVRLYTELNKSLI